MALKKTDDDAAEMRDSPQPQQFAGDAALVPMVLFDPKNGIKDRIEVHPTCVVAHQEAGWMIEKG